MSTNFAYAYAVIDASGWCYNVCSVSDPVTDDTYIAIDEYNEDYLMKYYNRADGKWYIDSAFTTEWTPT